MGELFELKMIILALPLPLLLLLLPQNTQRPAQLNFKLTEELQLMLIFRLDVDREPDRGYELRMSCFCVVKEWKQCVRVQRSQFVLKRLSETRRGSFLFTQTAV